MWIIELREPKDCTLKLPGSHLCLLNPMASDDKVAVDITRLPCIASQVDFALYYFALHDIRHYYRRRYKGGVHTLRRSFNFDICFLKESIISRRVALRFGTETPLVACEAMSIIFLKLGWSTAWIGWKCVTRDSRNSSKSWNTHLPSWYQPFNGCLTKAWVRVSNNSTTGRDLVEVTIEITLLCIGNGSSSLALLDILR